LDGRLNAYGGLSVGPDGDIEPVEGWPVLAQQLLVQLRSHRNDFLLHPEICMDLEDFMGEWVRPELLEQMQDRISQALVQAWSQAGDEVADVPLVRVDAASDDTVVITIELADLDQVVHRLSVPFSYREGFILPADMESAAGSLVEAYLL
jgi:hypothetical protein